MEDSTEINNENTENTEISSKKKISEKQSIASRINMAKARQAKKEKSEKRKNDIINGLVSIDDMSAKEKKYFNEHKKINPDAEVLSSDDEEPEIILKERKPDLNLISFMKDNFDKNDKRYDDLLTKLTSLMIIEEERKKKKSEKQEKLKLSEKAEKPVEKTIEVPKKSLIKF